MLNITGKQMKKARHIQDMTQEEAAKLLGIHRSYLSQIENGKVVPSEKLQRKIDHHFAPIMDRFLFID